MHVHMYIHTFTGLQPTQRVHCYPGTSARYSWRLLEACVGPQRGHHCDADQPGGEDEGALWRG